MHRARIYRAWLPSGIFSKYCNVLKKQWRKIVTHQTIVRAQKNPSFLHTSFTLSRSWLFIIRRFAFRIADFVFFASLVLGMLSSVRAHIRKRPHVRKADAWHQKASTQSMLNVKHFQRKCGQGLKFDLELRQMWRHCHVMFSPIAKNITSFFRSVYV